MGLFDFNKKSNEKSLYSGGNGKSTDSAIIINSDNSFIGVPAEYKYVIARHGQKDIDWKLVSQAALMQNGRTFDCLNIKLKTGESISYYFDITQFYGKF